MTNTFESGYRTTTTSKISPSDTQIFIKTQPAITKGRVYLSNSWQEERVSFDTVTTVGSVYRLNNCVRWLSRSADPATAWTGLTWIAGTVVKIVLMHDQPLDKQNDQTMIGKLDFWTNQGRLEFPEYTTTQRDAVLTWANWEVIHNTTTGTLQQRIWWGWSDFGNTGTPDASTTVAGKVEIATDAEVTSGTNTGGTGAQLVTQPSQLKTTNDNVTTANANILWLSTYFFWDGSDGNVTIWVNTTLTRDMYYNNLTVSAGFTLNPAWYKIHVAGTLLLDGTIARVWNVGTAASWVTAWIWWAALASGTLGTNVAWTNWGAGWSWVAAGSAATNWTANINTFSTTSWSAGWNGWRSDTQGWWAKWTAWTTTRWYLYNKTINKIWQFTQMWYTNIASYNSNQWGTGWGWGGSSSTGGNGWGWGWGWSAWWMIHIYANIFNNTATGVLSAIWWAGWAGAAWWAAAANSQVAWWGWGWGWGNGWTIFIYFNTYTNAWVISVAWWAAANGGNANRAGWVASCAWWNGWDGWSGGIVYLSQACTQGTITLTGWAAWTKGTDIWTPSTPSANGSAWSTGAVVVAS